MIWFLPIIVIGGLFFPGLGYFMVAMMAFFLVLSFFKARYWCWNLCPRGAFLDIVMSKLSRNKPIPAVFAKNWFRLGVFVLLMELLTLRIIRSGGHLLFIGAVFVGICLVTTIISIILAEELQRICESCPREVIQNILRSSVGLMLKYMNQYEPESQELKEFEDRWFPQLDPRPRQIRLQHRGRSRPTEIPCFAFNHPAHQTLADA